MLMKLTTGMRSSTRNRKTARAMPRVWARSGDLLVACRFSPGKVICCLPLRKRAFFTGLQELLTVDAAKEFDQF
jgi:hypothetical protein